VSRPRPHDRRRDRARYCHRRPCHRTLTRPRRRPVAAAAAEAPGCERRRRHPAPPGRRRNPRRAARRRPRAVRRPRLSRHDRADDRPEVAPLDAPPPLRRTTREVIDLLLERVDEHGVGPVLRALTQSDVDAATRDALIERLRERVIGPLTRTLHEDGTGDAKLRAELVVAMLIGVMTTRANGSMPLVAAADRAELADVVERMLAG
jgi:hypothetical protein